MLEAPTEIIVDPEMATLGAIILNPLLMDEVRNQGFDFTDFRQDKHKAIFSAMEALWDDKQPIDLVFLSDELKARGELDRVGGPMYLMDLEACVPTAAHGLSYAVMVKKHSFVRKYREFALTIAEMTETNSSPDELYSYIMEQIQTMNHSQKNDDVWMMWDESFEFTKELMNFYEERSQEEYLSWAFPWSSWNSIIPPMEEGVTCSLFAGTSVGKSITGENIAEHWAKTGKKICYVHFELGRPVKMTRRVSRHSNLSFREIQKPGKSEEEKKSIEDGEARLREWPGAIHYLKAANMSMEEVVRELTRMSDMGECDGFVIDYMEKCRPSKIQLRTCSTLWQRETDDVELIKSFGEMYRQRGILIHQYNKAGQEISFDDLSLEQISGAQQKADRTNIAGLLHRPMLPDGLKDDITGKYIVEPNGHSPFLQIKWVKNSNDRKGVTRQYVEGARFSIRDIAREI